MNDQDIIHLNCTRTNRFYRIVGYDPETKMATFKGAMGEFTDPYEPARLQELGYTRIVGPFDGMIEVE
jgi:hypothetical protein